MSIVSEAGWESGPVLTGAENLVTTGIPSPYLPACSGSLYRLSYPGLYAMNNKYNLIEVLRSQAVRCLHMCLQTHPLPNLRRTLSMLCLFLAVTDCGFNGCLWSRPGQILFRTFYRIHYSRILQFQAIGYVL